MKNSNPKNIALKVSLIITSIFSAIYLALNLILYWTSITIGSKQWIELLISAIVIFVVSYYIFLYTLEKFIYEKIKLIYKTIHSYNAKEYEDNKKSLLESDVLKEVNNDVVKWAQEKSNEIEELKKLEVYRREFIGNISHELKTPIFNIQGYVLTLLDGGLEDKNINRRYLERTEKSINRMITIVRDLETISQLESGEIEMKYEKFDILSLTKEIFEFLEIKAHKRNIHLQFGSGYDRPVNVEADKDRIRQVMTNLIDNSINYGNDNGTTKVNFYDMDNNILIEVSDNGIGIGQHHIPRLFERFYRTDKGRSREDGGTGLGLAIVKHIIEAHKQTVNVRSTIGTGTTFAFTLKKT
jgi:two-component system, OmpR family, phosphate regulon sensor histidine kinase PhoR